MRYFIILFLFIAIQLTAQEIIIRGTIINESDYSPIRFVNISIDGKNISSISNEEGEFEIKGNILQNDVVVFTHVGFETKRSSAENLLHKEKVEIFLSSKIITSQTILVKGSVAKEKISPISFSKINQNQIKQTYLNQDIPEVLSFQASITFYSENGNGLGYNYLSIRGFDQRRISVSINGVPQNDPEDHNVYWLDFPDLLESTELIQIQRGAGSGIIGYPAIGGSINIITSSFTNKQFLEFSSSIGTYNSKKYSLQYSSGLIANKYSFYSKISQTKSSGYRNSSWVNFISYHLSAVRFDENVTTQINIYGGPISDGLAYTGLPKFAVKNKNFRRENYSYWEADDKNYLYTLERKPDEIENFSQPHFELLNEIKLSDDLILNNTLYLVLGNGFFDYDGSWADSTYFRLTKNFGITTNRNPENALIRAMVENKQWGWIPRLNIKHTNGEIIIGGELRFHNSLHRGSIKYAGNLPESISSEYHYYQYEGAKDIFNLFLNENYFLNEKTNILVEGHLAYNRYKLFNEKYLNNEFEVTNIFFNSRVGINYKISEEWNVYGSFANVSREPRLTNYYDAAESSGGAAPKFEINSTGKYDFNKPLVKPETMYDFEFGNSYISSKFNFSANFFYMIFNNEIVKNGQVDRFGQPITGNMDNTIHYGFESSCQFNFNENVQFIFNGTASKNYIKNGFTYLSYVDGLSNVDKIVKLDLNNNTISGFPDFSFNAQLKFTYKNLFTLLSAKYVSAFYTDNYFDQISVISKKYPGAIDYYDNKVDEYFLVNLFISYDLKQTAMLNSVKLFLQINNVFDSLYAAYGIGKEFFPAAERNILFGIKMDL